MDRSDCHSHDFDSDNRRTTTKGHHDKDLRVSSSFAPAIRLRSAEGRDAARSGAELEPNDQAKVGVLR
ncbi:MAG: hypothetical protein R3B70_44345 [Polyangiaceae bacterium]